MRTFSRSGLTGLAAVAGLTLVTGCGSSTPTPAAPSTAVPATTNATQANSGLTVTNAWAKAVPELGSTAMTGVFGTITNTTNQPVTIVSGSNSVSSLTELHETVMKDGAKVMQPVKGGFVIEAGKTRELKPGSDHVMVMKMTKPLKAGDPVEVTLTTTNGATVTFTAVAKPFTMGNEPYAPAGSASAPASTASHG